MTQKNIWTGFHFSKDPEPSAYDLLITQKDDLTRATEGELSMEIEAVDSFIDGNPPKPVALYVVFIVAPKLNNYRRKIITVVEGRMEGRFPVEVFCHIDNDKKPGVTKDEFLDVIQEVLSRHEVKSSIEGLYLHSKSIGTLVGPGRSSQGGK